jgi:hypothetical protein
MRSLMICTAHPIFYVCTIKWRRTRRARHVARVGTREAYARFLVVRNVGKRPLGKPRRRCEDNIKMALQDVEQIATAQVRDRWWTLVNAVMNLLVP